MIQGRKWLDAVREQFIHKSIVEIEAFWVWRTCSFRKNARPGNRKAIGLYTHRLDELNVLFVAVIMVVCDVRIAVIQNFPGCVSVSIPIAWAPLVVVDGPFDLIG